MSSKEIRKENAEPVFAVYSTNPDLSYMTQPLVKLHGGLEFRFVTARYHAAGRSNTGDNGEHSSGYKSLLSRH